MVMGLRVIGVHAGSLTVLVLFEFWVLTNTMSAQTPRSLHGCTIKALVYTYRGHYMYNNMQLVSQNQNFAMKINFHSNWILGKENLLHNVCAWIPSISENSNDMHV